MNLRNHSTELIVALDFPRPDHALDLVDRLQGLPVIYKVGLELFLSAGPEVVRELVHRKNRVFLDLKFHDIPNTVAKAVMQASLLHVDLLTVHLAGGSALFRSIAEGLSEIPTLRPKVLGVSVLTSFDDVRWAEVTKAICGHASEVSNSVEGLVEHSASWIDGVVCSAMELPLIRKRFPSLFTVVPGIRPEGFSMNDQSRVVTPALARSMGAHAVVVGRPITQAPESKEVVKKILADLAPSDSFKEKTS